MYDLSGVWWQPWAEAQGRQRRLDAAEDRVLARAPLPMDWPDVDEAAIQAEMDRRLVQRGWGWFVKRTLKRSA